MNKITDKKQDNQIEKIKFNILVLNRDTNKIEVHQVSINLQDLINFKNEMINYYGKSELIKEQNSELGLMAKYNLENTGLEIISKEYVGKGKFDWGYGFTDDKVDIYNLEYYTYTKKRLINNCDIMLKCVESDFDINNEYNIFEQTVNFFNLLHFDKSDNNEKMKCILFLSNVEVNPTPIEELPNTNITNALENLSEYFKSKVELTEFLRNLSYALKSDEIYKKVIKAKQQRSTEIVITEMEKNISKGHNINNFRFPTFTRPVINTVAKRKIKRRIVSSIPSNNRINGNCNQK